MNGFKGFWIPLELLSLDISWTKRILLAEISQLELEKLGCIASNSHFSNKLNITKQAISKALNELAKDNLILIDNAQTKRNYGRKITINFSVSAINFSVGGVHESGESKDNKQFNKQVSTLYAEKWNKFATDNELKKIAKMTDTRKKKLASRIEEAKDFEKLFDAVLTKIEDSSFLTGNNSNDWTVDFDWLITNDTNMIKVYEGKYND